MKHMLILRKVDTFLNTGAGYDMFTVVWDWKVNEDLYIYLN